MTITGNVVQAPAGMIGFDTIDVLDATRANEYLRRGYQFCIRYVSHDQGRSEYVDLTADEAQTIVDSGLALMVVQHPLDAGWAPDAGLGTADQLYWDIRTTHYWKGGSSAEAGVPDEIPHRGYQMVQRINDPGPEEFDSDVTKTDALGGGVMWVVNG
jgi:Domain of unknown function (DUF1906)